MQRFIKLWPKLLNGKDFLALPFRVREAEGHANKILNYTFYVRVSLPCSCRHGH